MMKKLHGAAWICGAAIFLLAGSAVFAASKAGWFEKKLRDAEFRVRPVLDADEIRSLLGTDLDKRFILVEVEVQPLYNSNIELDRDDFLVRSRKDNERSSAMSPSEMAGESVLVLGEGQTQSAGVFSDSRGPIIPGGPVGGRPRRIGGDGGSFGNSGSASGPSTVKAETRESASLLERLNELELPSGETRKAVRGYLYFQVSLKNKLKHLNLDYDGAAGEFQVEFGSKK